MAVKETPRKLELSHLLPFLLTMNYKVRTHTGTVHYRTSPQHSTLSPGGRQGSLALPRQGRCKCAETQPAIGTCNKCQECLYKIQRAHVFSRLSAAPGLQGLGEAGAPSQLSRDVFFQRGWSQRKIVPTLRTMRAVFIRMHQ